MTRMRVLALLALIGAIPARADDAPKPDDPAAVEFFEARVRPLLVERCQGCHGAAKSKGGLRLDSKDLAMAGGPTGPAIVPGKPGESLLIEAINYAEILQMPPKSKLPDEEIATLTRWVAQGAVWPSGGEKVASGQVKPFDLAERSKHWSLQPVRDPAIPDVRDAAWPINPVDRFLLAKLEAKGIKPAGEADRPTLIRRLSFDLTGLPPRPDEVRAFVDDPAPDAYEKLVDRLLASPHYGERWARHWLDLVRFSETSGHEFDYEIPEAYRYRDYVIRAFNLDLPYDQFVVEHLAGDLLANPRREPGTGNNESILGTGFFRLHEGVHSPVDLREDGASKVDNQIDVMGKAFLGLTIACARCHDHKFDAITTKDYYAMAGFLNSSRHQLAFLDPPDRIGSKVAEIRAIRDEVAALFPTPASSECPVDPDTPDILFETFSGKTFDRWYVAGDAFGTGPTGAGSWKVRGDGVTPLPPGVAHSGAISDRLRGVLRSRNFPLDRPYVHFLASGKGGRINLVVDGFEKIRSPIYGGLVVDVNHGDDWKWITMDVAQWAGHTAYIEIDDGATVDFTGSRGRIRDGAGFIAIDEIRLSDAPPPPVAPSTTPTPIAEGEKIQTLMARYRAVEATIPEATMGQALTDGTGVDVKVHIRGSTRNLGEPAPRQFLEVFGGPEVPAPSDGSGRLELARRVADPTNPLTARVMVNRLWHHHFGRGIVPSVDDFGAMGREPTHPELLDHLASRFVESGWSIKAIHRLIVNSRAYRMSSQLTPEADQLDPSNELWHRRDVRRLEAEAIRDAILAVSGRLDPTLFGPSVAPHLTPFMDGRGRPDKSGPLDGDGRRSIYLNVRRNFLTPMLLAFDYPTPSSTMGRRNVSNVPAQALTLMNDPFLVEQAKVWANRVRTDPRADPGSTIETMYREAYGRPPAPEERAAALAFLEEQCKAYGQPEDPRAWADLAHVLFNVKEFVAIP
ncbi:PSD1 and planctomycete cytochrome C domain-containing protein [Tundrisphaera lichenicola]|uniref:PSD1 and planctomycete cytochrome C domain-containing protein n=1 Tax=Tundrisphaera lichenicola TaxID=2029860 RepID=UPI003EB8BB39